MHIQGTELYQKAPIGTQLGDSIMVQPFSGGPGYSGFPPPGSYPPPAGAGIPPYPGPPGIQAAFPYGPSFDGLNAHGLTTNAYTNSLFEDVNVLQGLIYSGRGVGYPSIPPFPPQGPPPSK